MNLQLELPWLDASTHVATDPEQLHTLYFMLMLPLQVQQRALRVCKTLQDQLGLRGAFIEPSRMHITLLALGKYRGEPPPSWLAALRHAASRVHAHAVPLELDRARSFSRAFVLVGSCPNPAINQLRKALRQSLRATGWTHTANTRAHLTLSYEEQRHAECPIEPLCWTARSFCLLDSLYGRHEHRVLGEWPLLELAAP